MYVCILYRRLVQSRPELVDYFIAMNCPHLKFVTSPLHIQLHVFVSFRVYMKIFYSNFRQILSSWVRINITLLSYHIAFLFQYIFVFQLPYLPELLMKCRDFNFLKRIFLSKPMVCNIFIFHVFN